MKEKSDEKILTLKQEILTMKQMKVRLIQQMKSENEKFKSFKAEKDREVCQLRTQNIKRQNQLKKMEQMHTLQQNVLRRKLEAAAAANKRIMAALERQKAAREKKGKAPSSEKIKERMAEELELLESEYQAQKSLDNLLQDRAALTKELAVIKESLEDDLISEEEKVKLRSDKIQVEQELELRSAEISDLQQKLLDLHQDDRGRNSWEMLQSMADAKFALNYLFNLASEKLKDNLDKCALLSDLKEQQYENDLQLAEYQQKLVNLETHHKKTLEKMEKECEEKVYVFMKLTAENMENEKQQGAISETLKKQVEEFEKLEYLRQRIEELEEENAQLKSNPNDTISKDPFQKFLQDQQMKMNGTFILPEPKKHSKKKAETTFTLADEESLKALDESIEIESDDPDKDPDWRNTPIHKRLQALKKGKLGKRKSNKDDKCECIGSCEKDCACMKSNSACGENCSCDRTKCSSEGPKRFRTSRLVVDFNSGSSRIKLNTKDLFD